MPDPTVEQGHYDEVLTSASVAWAQRQDRFIAPMVFPTLPVAKASGFYYEIPRGSFFRDEVGPRPIGGPPRQVGYNLLKKQYFIEEEALEAMLDDRERANYSAPADPEETKVRLLTSQHMVHRDKRWASGFFGTGIWGTDVTGVGAGPTGNQILQWNNASSTPLEDIDNWRDTNLSAIELPGSG